MRHIVLIIILILVVRCRQTKLPEDASLTTLEIVKKYGHDGEEHKVVTKDGYILTIHRMFPVKGCEDPSKVIFLMNGIIATSADWVVVGPKKGFAFLLSDACFDVWMGNARGTTYARQHAWLDNNSSKYWDFSWHEMGIYDTPAMVDYVLNKTGNKALDYIGFSQGSTQFFVYNSLFPEDNHKIRVMVAMAPIAYVGHAQNSLLRKFARHVDTVDTILAKLGVHQVFANWKSLPTILGYLCHDNVPKFQNNCAKVIFSMAGADEKQLNKSMLPIHLGHTPSGAAVKQFVHYGQLFNSGKFAMFDYGKDGNMKRYGSETPPEYPLENATTPIAICYGNNDYLASLQDIDILYKKLHTPVGKYLVPFDHFNHIDHTWAIDANTLLYKPIIKFLENFNHTNRAEINEGW